MLIIAMIFAVCGGIGLWVGIIETIIGLIRKATGNNWSLVKRGLIIFVISFISIVIGQVLFASTMLKSGGIYQLNQQLNTIQK